MRIQILPFYMHGGRKMRNSVTLFRTLVCASLALALTIAVADAKKKKPTPVPDCESAEYVEECDPSRAIGTSDAANNNADNSAKSDGSNVLVPPEPITGSKPSGVQAASANVTDEIEEIDTSEWYTGTMPDEPYDIPLVDRSKMDAKFERQEIAYDGKEPVGSIVVDIDRKFLYFIAANGLSLIHI